MSSCNLSMTKDESDDNLKFLMLISTKSVCGTAGAKSTVMCYCSTYTTLPTLLGSEENKISIYLSFLGPKCRKKMRQKAGLLTALPIFRTALCLTPQPTNTLLIVISIASSPPHNSLLIFPHMSNPPISPHQSTLPWTS